MFPGEGRVVLGGTQRPASSCGVSPLSLAKLPFGSPAFAG